MIWSNSTSLLIVFSVLEPILFKSTISCTSDSVFSDIVSESSDILPSFLNSVSISSNDKIELFLFATLNFTSPST